MIDHDELVLAGDEPDPAFLDLTEQITERLQAGEEIDVRDYVRRYPQWAGAILQAAADHAAISSTMAGPSTATAGRGRQQTNPDDRRHCPTPKKGCVP